MYGLKKAKEQKEKENIERKEKLRIQKETEKEK